MHCPRCRAEPPHDPFVCTTCGERLLAYLDEPFGPGSGVRSGRSPGGAAAASATDPRLRDVISRLDAQPGPDDSADLVQWTPAPPRPRQHADASGIMVLKALFGLGIGIILYLSTWPPMGLLFLGLLAFGLWRWPRARLLPTLGVLLAGGIAFGMLGSALDSAEIDDLFFPAPTPTAAPPPGTRMPNPALASPTLLPAQRTATATVVAGQSRALLSRARARWLRGDNDAALKELDQALVLQPRQAEALNLRALVRIAAGDHLGALRDAEQAIVVQPSTWSYRDTHAYASLKLQRYEEAQAEYQVILPRLTGEQKTASLLGRGVALTALGRLPEARLDLEEGLRLLPDRYPDPQLADLEASARHALDPPGAVPAGPSPAASPAAPSRSPAASPAATPESGAQPGRAP